MGIKHHLSLQVNPQVGNDDVITLQQRATRKFCWVVSQNSSNRSVAVHRYFWLHPRLTVPNPPSWTRGPGFVVPVCDAKAWQLGIEKLWRVTPRQYEAVNKLALFEIRYSTRSDEYKVKFFIENKLGTPYYQIQAWQLGKKGWDITRRCVYWPCCDNALGQALYDTLNASVHLAFNGIIDSDDLEIVNGSFEGINGEG